MTRNKEFTDLISASLELNHAQETVLLRLLQSPSDIALASTLPCAAEAIKNMANFYGCKHIVAFSSVFEGVLSKVRDSELRAEGDLNALLLSCCDHVSKMVSQLATSDEIYLGHFKKSLGLIRQLHAYHGNEIKHATTH